MPEYLREPRRRRLADRYGGNRGGDCGSCSFWGSSASSSREPGSAISSSLAVWFRPSEVASNAGKLSDRDQTEKGDGKNEKEPRRSMGM